MSKSKPHIRIPVKTLRRPAFLPAFLKLCADPLPAASKFRLAGAKRLLIAKFEDAERLRNEKIKECGLKEIDLIRRRLEVVKGLPTTTPNRATILTGLEAHIAELSMPGMEERYCTDPDDAGKLATFKQFDKELGEEEFNTELPGRVQLLKETKLDANDIAELLELVDPPQE